MTGRDSPRGRPEHPAALEAASLRTERLALRPWRTEDATEALTIFGDDEVTRWMSPALTTVRGAAAMEELLTSWQDEASCLAQPQGRWAIRDGRTGDLLGGATLLLLPPYRIDLEVGWHLGRSSWGHGYATEAGRAVADHAFRQGEDEVFAVVRPHNRRGCATALRVGMEWVGETDKYYDLRLNVYRLRSGDHAVAPEPGPDLV